MALRNKATLKKYFESGKMPTEDNFKDLIDSTVNIVDKEPDHFKVETLTLDPYSEDETIINIKQKIDDKHNLWSFTLCSKTGHLSVKQSDSKEVISISQEGYIGIGQHLPEYQLHTSRSIGIHGRVGTYASGLVAADGKWHDITQSLKGVAAFEVIAGYGNLKAKHVDLTIATATQCFGRRRSIKRHRKNYFGFPNRIRLRWKRESPLARRSEVTLQMRSIRDYGKSAMLSYNISSLWDNHLMSACTKDKE